MLRSEFNVDSMLPKGGFLLFQCASSLIFGVVAIVLGFTLTNRGQPILPLFVIGGVLVLVAVGGALYAILFVRRRP